jgi:hypothetical protein
VVHEEEEASGAFACQRETSGLVAVAAAVAAEEDSALLARSVCCQGAVPIPEEDLHAGAVGDLHYYTNIRVVEVHEEVQVHHVASVAAAAGCTEEARHTEDVLP